MIQDSKSIAFILAISIFIINGIILYLLKYSLSIIFFTGFIQFFFYFLSTYILFEILWFHDFRNLKRKIYKLSINNKMDKKKNIPFQKKQLSTFIENFIEETENKINELVELENYRKEFIADIAHELKTPLFAAQSYIETLQKNTIKDIEVRDKFLNKSFESLNYLGQLIENLTMLSKLELNQTIIRFKTFNIKLLCEKVFEQLHTQAEEKNIKLKFSKNYSNIWVQADKTKIYQVLINLISNGVKYSYKNTVIYVGFEKNIDYLKVEISNQGERISEKHKKKIFERFYRIEKSRSRETGGMGLGLAIVKKILDMHNVTIQVNTTHKITTFVFQLPITKTRE